MEPSESFNTPILDAEAPALLQRITEQGGYAFSTITASAARGDLRAAEAAREMAWEQLHSGPSTSVPIVWRDAYSMASLHLAKAHYACCEFKDASRVVSLGLSMGGTLLRNDLEDAARKLNDKVRCGDDNVVSKEAADRNSKEEEDEDCNKWDTGGNAESESEVR